MAQAHSNYKEQGKSKGEQINFENGIPEITPKQSNFTLHMLSFFLPANFPSANSAYCKSESFKHLRAWVRFPLNILYKMCMF